MSPTVETPEKQARRAARQKITHREWYLRNREKVIARARAHYIASNKEQRRQNQSEWRKRNPDKTKEIARRWREGHKALARSRIKRWHDENKARTALKKKEYIAQLSPEKLEKIRAKIRKWAREHPDVGRANCQKRRAAKLKATFRPEKIVEWMARLRFGPALPCYYCRAPISGSAIHFDHIIPISRGGPHEIGNLAASCRACNLAKSSHFIGVWNVKSGQQVLSL